MPQTPWTRRAVLGALAALPLLPTGGQAAPIQSKNPFGLPSVIRRNKGFPILLHIWSTECATCVATLPEVNEVAKEFRQDGLRILSLSVDKSKNALQAFLEEQPTTWSHYWIHSRRKGDLRDALRQVGAKYAGYLPYSAIFNREGRIVVEWAESRPGEDYRRVIEPLLWAIPDEPDLPTPGDEVGGWVLQEDGSWGRE